MSGILRLESLTKGNTLRQGDLTLLKYRLFETDGDKLDISGKSATVRLMKNDFTFIAYEKEGLTVAPDDTISFNVNKILPGGLYHLEVIVDDKYIFPSRDDEGKLNIDKSSLGADVTIIEATGVEAVARKATGMMKQDEEFIDDMVINVIDSDLAKSITQGIDAKATNALNLSESADTLSKSVQSEFNQIITGITDKDIVSAPEIIGARGGFDTLGGRLDDTTTQLAQTMIDLNQRGVNMKRLYGLKGNGIADDTQGIINAINDITVNSFYLPAGTYLVKGTAEVLFLINRSIKLIGDGENRTTILVDSTVPNTTDIFRIAPTKLLQFIEIDGIAIANSGGTNFPARHNIHIDLTAPGAGVKNTRITNNFFNAVDKESIKLTNPDKLDGFFTSQISGNTIYGGMNLERSGDSVLIERNIIAGKGVGIRLSTVAGAYRTYINANNITSAQGAIVLADASQVTITDNQMEQVSSRLGGNSAVVVVNGGYNNIIENNNIDNNGHTDFSMTVDGSENTIIDKNALSTGSGKHLLVGSASKDTYIGYRNTYRKNASIVQNPSIDNFGSGTTNVDVPLTLLNGWTEMDVANRGNTLAHKTSDGIVSLFGRMNNGVVTRNTQIFILPEGMRPRRVLTRPVYSQNNSGTVVPASIQILPTGEVSIQEGANYIFELGGVSFKANG